MSVSDLAPENWCKHITKSTTMGIAMKPYSHLTTLRENVDHLLHNARPESAEAVAVREAGRNQQRKATRRQHLPV